MARVIGVRGGSSGTRPSPGIRGEQMSHTNFSWGPSSARATRRPRGRGQAGGEKNSFPSQRGQRPRPAASRDSTREKPRRGHSQRRESEAASGTRPRRLPQSRARIRPCACEGRSNLGRRGGVSVRAPSGSGRNAPASPRPRSKRPGAPHPPARGARPRRPARGARRGRGTHLGFPRDGRSRPPARAGSRGTAPPPVGGRAPARSM